jgi:dephospho-CoA kinase
MPYRHPVAFACFSNHPQTPNMLRIGLTGGIGSGKSTVAGIFEVLGIPVYYADKAAKSLMQHDELLKDEIIRLFGEESYVNGILNRAWLSQQVFGDPEKTKAINALVHPATIRDAKNWMSMQHAPYAIKEAALVFESGSEKELELVIGVSAPENLRVQRVMARDGITEDMVRQRMSKQMSEDEKISRCDFVILNDDHTPLIPQVLTLHRKLLDMTNRQEHT